MSSDPDIIEEVINPGDGFALDLGGGQGIIYDMIKEKGYDYVNMDLAPSNRDGYSVKGDGHYLPFKDNSFSLIVCKDTLEHFLSPHKVVDEIHRVLQTNGHFILWVPFLHPFHGNDYFRFTPLGLGYLLRRFEIISIESPLWLFSFAGSVLNQLLKRIKMNNLQVLVRRLCKRMDQLFMKGSIRPSGYAYGYRVVAIKKEIQ